LFYFLTKLVNKVRRDKKFGLLFVLIILLFGVIGNSICFYIFERAVNPSITVSDSLWYSVISITTIGYGDFNATQIGSRLGTLLFVVVISLSAFTTILAIIVDWITDLRERERRGMTKVNLRDHLIIVNFPGESRILQIIAEYSLADNNTSEIVLISDEIEQLPFSRDNVTFIRGWPLEEETFTRSNISKASQVMVLSPNYLDHRSDSFVASIAFVVQNLNPEIRVVAECLHPKHETLFGKSENLSIVHTIQMANNLLVQEASDPGVALFTHSITSNEISANLFSICVEEGLTPGKTYGEISKNIVGSGVNVLGIIREGVVISDIGDMMHLNGDIIVYVSEKRISWSEIIAHF